ncbi:MAG: hypothetical protein ACREQ5_34900 [Candidatus Dormibacteria bacterium]
MGLRGNDVLVGAVTGACAAVVAAIFEAFFVAERLLSLGTHGGFFGSKILFILIVGAIVGAIVGFALGSIARRPQGS